MELLSETNCNSISDVIKKEQNDLPEEKKKSPKKKFYNTVFATKMRNRKKEEKLEKLEGKEVLSACKPVSVDVTRLSSNVMPKVISSIVHKNRKKKKFQWKLGKTKKKKKIRHKSVKVLTSNTNNVNIKSDESVKNNDIKPNIDIKNNDDIKNNVQTDESKEKLSVSEKQEEKFECATDKDDTQRRKSMRHVTPTMFFDEKWDFETKPDNGQVSEEKFSCRRTEPFMGKLDTREARILNVEMILKEENKPSSKDKSNDLLDENSKNLSENIEDEASVIDKSIIETKETIENNNIIELNKNKKSNESVKSNKKLEASNNKKHHESKDIVKNIMNTLKNTENIVDIQKSNNISQEVIETKEEINNEETTCRRIMPFVGKTSQKALPGTSQRSIKINSTKSDVHTKSKFSKYAKIKSNSSSKKGNVKLISSKDKDTKNSSSSNLNTESNMSINSIKSQPGILSKDKNDFKYSVEDVNVKTDVSNEIDSKENLNSNIKLDCSSNNVNLMTEESLVNDDKNEIWSCRRTEPFLGRNYPNCTRTLPFAYSVNKVKSTNTARNSTSSDVDLLSQTITDRSHRGKTYKLIKKFKQSKDTNIPQNQETELINTLIDSTDTRSSTSAYSTSDDSVHSDDWKFRRKRPKIMLSSELQEEEHPSKKSKVKISSEISKSLSNKKPTVNPSSPDRTICSLFSLNCSKHVHGDECSISHKKIMKDVFVLLTKLEYISDPLVAEYFKKTDFTNKVKQNFIPPREDKVKTEEPNTSLNSQNLLLSYENGNEPATKDDSTSPYIPDTSSESNSSNYQIDDLKKLQNIRRDSERSISPPPRRPTTRSRRRPFSETSSESLNIIGSKRRKRPVNYVEDFSDSETESISSSTKRDIMKMQNRRLTLRNRQQQLRTLSNQEMDENDMEVEEFTRNGITNSVHSKRFDSRNTTSSTSTCQTNRSQDSYAFNHVRPRAKSVTENIMGQPNIHSIDKNSSLELPTELKKQVSNEWPQIHGRLNKKPEDISKHILRPRSQGSASGQVKNLQQTDLMLGNNIEIKPQISSRNGRVSIFDLEDPNEQLLTSAKISNKNDGKRLKISKADDFSGSFKKSISNLSRNEKDNSLINENRSCTPKSSKQIMNSVSEKFNKSKMNFELSPPSVKHTTKTMPLTNLKVQLIKLEAVCDSFEDYSASEIELLTRKYIDLLMNSNFTCDTWHNPINYHRSGGFIEKHIEQVDNSDCISDVELQDDSEPSTTVAESENATLARTKSIFEENSVKLKAKSSKQLEATLSSFTTLESAIATLVDAEPGEQHNFGSVNISDALGSPSSSRIHKEKDQTDHSKQNEINENQLHGKDKHSAETILVNGTTMYPCSACNKIFVVENSLKNHQAIDHKGNTDCLMNADSTSTFNSNSANITTVVTAATSSTTNTTPKGSRQKSPASATAKKTIQKCKKKFRCSDSLQCTICSTTYESKELLFDHIMTHNEQELQEAYKNAKAKAKQSEGSNSLSEESDKDGVQEISQSIEALKKKKKDKDKDKKRRKKSTDSSIRSSRSSMDTEDVIFEDPLRNVYPMPPVTVGQQQQQMVDLVGNEVLANGELLPGGATITKPISICQCHAHETTVQDLQIEMVLLCKTCNVVFRRRDCFEVHYRTSVECRRRRTNNEVTKMPKLFCSGCPCVLDSLLDMRAHLEMHAKKNSQGTVTFICNICKVAFFGVGGIFYSHWFNHTKAPNFVASRYSFPKLSVVSVLEDSNVAMTTSKSQEGFFYIAEHVCRQCRLPFSSEPELLKHKSHPCQTQITVPRMDNPEVNRLQMIKLICDLCKKYYVSKENFDRHCSERNHLKTPITKFSRLPINANEQAFVCSLCRAVSKSLDELKEHWKRIHSPIMELYTCKTCNVVPSNDVTNYTYEKFERHCRIVHKSEVITCLVYFVTARYVCNICRFGFETEKSMKEHQVQHQKRSSQNVNNNVPGMPIDPQTATLWVADKQVAADGGRKIHPVYVHYPGINGTVNHTLPIIPTTVNTQVQNQTSIRHPNHVNNQSNICNKSNAAVNSNLGQEGTPNSMLRTMLAEKSLDQSTSQQSSNNIETIFLDSRSNSPTSEPVAGSKDKSTGNNADAGASARKSYMTMVNPNFESLLGTNSTTRMDESNNDNSVLDKEHSDSGGTVTPVSMDLLTPQPFEVVLVTDELSENSNCDSPITSDRAGPPMEKALDVSNSTPIQNQHQTIDEGASNKSSKFLRVRSIAELQRMKINLCSICGLSFDTLQAFEQHSQQHEMNGEMNRMTPVQMISPMLAQGNKPSNLALRQNMAVLSPNGNEMTYNLDTHKSNPPILPNHFPPPQPTYAPYWYHSIKGGRYNPYNMQPPTVDTYTYRHPSEPILQTPVSRRPINLSHSGGTYITRGPPPAYPGTSNTIAPSRSSAIQLPERNTAGSGTPTTKRPSGAATRIPQQSLPNYGGSIEQRQTNPIRMPPYAPSMDPNNSRIMANPAVRHSQHNPPFKTYNRHSGEFNYSSSIGTNPNYHHPTQQQHSSKVIYNCKLQNCPFRSDNLATLRAHEKSHMNHPPMPSNAMQQRLPMKHVPVSQMPERPRHALPTGRQPTMSGIPEKPFVCHMCNLYCSTENDLVDHVAQCPNSPKVQCCYVCDYCTTPLIFNSEDLLRKHMSTSHNHPCELCSKRYPSKEDLMLHMEVHARAT